MTMVSQCCGLSISPPLTFVPSIRPTTETRRPTTVHLPHSINDNHSEDNKDKDKDNKHKDKDNKHKDKDMLTIMPLVETVTDRLQLQLLKI